MIDQFKITYGHPPEFDMNSHNVKYNSESDNSLDSNEED
jgi:hypothetical protein